MQGILLAKILLIHMDDRKLNLEEKADFSGKFFSSKFYFLSSK
jgi:hypothetical protein